MRTDLLASNVYQCLKDRIELCTILEHRPVRSCGDVVRILNVPLELVVKCLVLGGADDSMVLASVPGDRRVNIVAVEQITGSHGLKPVGANQAAARTGLPLGAISPIGVPKHIKVVVDQAIAQAEIVYCGTGKVNSSLIIPGRILVELAEAIVAPIAD